MIILDRGADDSIPDAGELLEFLLGSAPATALPFVVSAVEFDDVNSAVNPVNQHGVSNGVTAVTILDPPSDTDLTRQLKAVSIYNPNTGNVDVTIRFNDDGTTRIIIKTTLEPTDTLQYNDGEGFRVIDANGNLKIIESAAPANVYGSNQGSLNGITAVEIVAAPSASTTREIRSIRLVNKDTIVQNIRIRKLVSGTPYEFGNSIALAVSGVFNPVLDADVIYLTDTTQSITAIMDGAAITTNPVFIASWIDHV